MLIEFTKSRFPDAIETADARLFGLIDPFTALIEIFNVENIGVVMFSAIIGAFIFMNVSFLLILSIAWTSFRNPSGRSLNLNSSDATLTGIEGKYSDDSLQTRLVWPLWRIQVKHKLYCAYSHWMFYSKIDMFYLILRLFLRYLDSLVQVFDSITDIADKWNNLSKKAD